MISLLCSYPIMPPAKVKPTDFIDALLDQQVIDAISKALMPMITLSIQEAIDSKLRSILSDITTLKRDNISLHAEVDKLQSVVSTLRQSERDVRVKLDALEAYQRSDNIVVRGLSESTYAEVGSRSADRDEDEMIRAETVVAAEETFLKFCNERLHVRLASSDISTAHRLPKGKKTRFVLLLFASRTAEVAIWFFVPKKCFARTKESRSSCRSN